MTGIMTGIDVSVTTNCLGGDVLDHLDADEAALVAEVSGRADTASIVLRQGGAVIGYAVFGLDVSDMVTVYAARAWRSMVARATMQGIFGASQVLGVPLRVHAERVRAMARYMGATNAVAAIDGDGIPMGLFHGL